MVREIVEELESVHLLLGGTWRLNERKQRVSEAWKDCAVDQQNMHIAFEEGEIAQAKKGRERASHGGIGIVWI